MNLFRKFICLFCICFIYSASIFALPGFKSYVNDVAGEYVYYEDKTFSRKSFVGFLCYDEKTFAARYYAPAQKNMNEINVTVYFTIDENATNLKITGEKLVGSGNQSDGEIINYLEDMFYSFSSHRSKVKNIALDSERIVPDDFLQFGGEVVIEYDYLIPLFNVKKIAKGDDMSIVFEVITTGRLTSSSDTSFSKFAGLPDKYESAKSKLSINKKATSQKYTTQDGQNITLDSQWKQTMDNMWMLGDSAVLSMAAIPLSSKAENVTAETIRRMIQSSSTSYSDWRNMSITLNGSTHTLTYLLYDSEKKSTMRVIRKLTKRANGYLFFTITIFENDYKANSTYFNNLLKTYSN